MSEYIEREALRDALYEADAITMKGIAIINQFPAADVAPVVRSRACKHFVNATINANGFLICDISDMEIAPDDFCSSGEVE